MKLKFRKSKLLGFLFALLTSPSSVYAACSSGPGGLQIGDCFGFGGIKSLGSGTSRLILPIFSIATILVVLYFLMGAFKFLKSGGNKEELQGARQMITQSIIGFLILMFSFFVLQFLLYKLFDVQGFINFI